MQKKVVSGKNAICILFNVILPTVMILGVPTKSEQDSWIAILLNLALLIPLLFMYGRIFKIIPNMDLFEINNFLFGKVLSSVLSIYFILFFIYSASVSLRVFSEFFRLISFKHTPLIIMLLILIIAPIYLVKSGMETLGKWAFIVVVTAFVIELSLIIFNISIFDLQNILPIMEFNIKDIFTDSLNLILYPMSDILLIFLVADKLKNNYSSYKVFLYGAMFSFIFLLLVLFRDILILSPELRNNILFPVFKSSRLIKIGRFIQRFEALIAYNYVLVQITKVALCLHGINSGISSIFNLKTHKKIIIPIAFVCIACSLILFKTDLQTFGFVDTYRYVAAPAAILFPLIIWITAEIKFSKNKKQQIPIINQQLTSQSS